MSCGIQGAPRNKNAPQAPPAVLPTAGTAEDHGGGPVVALGLVGAQWYIKDTSKIIKIPLFMGLL